MAEQVFPEFDAEAFDQWANHYDEEIIRENGFPFEGYSELMDEILRRAETKPGMHILDLGTGTGELAGRFAGLGCIATGSDFSPEMLKAARQKYPALDFHFQDLRLPWPADLTVKFDRIVSAYTLHHFLREKKIELLQDMTSHLEPGGFIVIGDLCFENTAHLDEARLRYGDAWDEELYWIKSEVVPALEKAGFGYTYKQVSYCAGVYTIFTQNR